MKSPPLVSGIGSARATAGKERRRTANARVRKESRG
jgi:hypothetical protein